MRGSSACAVVGMMLTLMGLASCLFNPGILVTIPFANPLTPPVADLHLPLSIEPILINQLQLSQISLTTLTYKWQFTQNLASINISNMGIIFFWKYKSDSGYGSFTQTLYQLEFDYQFVMDSKNRLKINVLKSKSKLGHSQVHLGGNVKQTVAIEVTNLVLNHAAIIFRSKVSNLIGSTIQSFSSILSNDPKLACPSNPSHCLYMNFTLQSPPIVSNKTLLIQMNGASYVSNEKSGEVNPDSVLIKRNTSKISVQVHLKVLQIMVQKMLTLLPQQFQFDITDKFTTFDITTRVVSTLFPLMDDYLPERKLSMDISQIQVKPLLNAKDKTIDALIQTSINVLTVDPVTGKKEKYLSKPCNVSALGGVKIIYGWKALSARLNKISVTAFECEQFDVQENFVNPAIFQEIIPTLEALLKAGVNGALNLKLVQLQFNGIQAVLSGLIQQNEAIFDLDLKPAQNIMNSQSSGFKVLLDN